MEKYGLALPADNDQSVLGGMENKKVSVFTRKAPYNYGWDWGPRLVTSGIWRPVVLEAWNEVRIEDTYIHPLKVDSKLAQLNAEITLTAAHPQTADIEIRHGNRIVSQQSVPLKSGKTGSVYRLKSNTLNCGGVTDSANLIYIPSIYVSKREHRLLTTSK